MITLFPIAWWSGSSRGGASGTNWPGFAVTDRTHPYAAAIMAQEIYESRYKSVRMLPIIVIGTVVALAVMAFGFGYAIGPMEVAVAMVGSIVLAQLTVGLLPVFQQTLELRGQMIECFLREDIYGTPFETATAEALRQLKGYDQFTGWSADKMRSRFFAEQDYCGKWVGRNRKLVGRIVEDLTTD